MADQYDFGNLSPIEFEAFVIDLMSAELGLRFESFSEGADQGIDGRHSSAAGNIILQAKHYKDSTWSDLQSSAKKERSKISKLNPTTYYFLTSQKITPSRKESLIKALNHASVISSNILGRTELNALLKKHSDVERRNIKLWLSSAAVMQRLINNDVAVFTATTMDGIERILKVFVANPSLPRAAKILKDQHCLIVSGPPGVGKTTLAQVLAAEYCEEGWELVAMSSIDDGNRSFIPDKKQVFVFDDFLGTIKLEAQSLAKDDAKIAAFMKLVSKRDTKRFILTTRRYILQSARKVSEALDEHHVSISEMVLDLDVYTREIKARILYNHLYHSGLAESAIEALLKGDTIVRIVDHKHYMPRIVEWMTDQVRFKDVSPDSYPSAFLSALDNPEKIWEKPFKQHISQEARILLYCLYFSKFEGYSKTGANLTKLELFFKRSLISFAIKADESLQEERFRETLGELKSSFIVLQDGRVSFINPSVQDFLARQVEDEDLIVKLSTAVPTFENASALWAAAFSRLKNRPLALLPIASSLLNSIQSGGISGRMNLENLADLIGELILREEQPNFIQFLRSGGLANTTWINESDLPSLIDDLLFGKYKKIPHSIAYGRFLRKYLYVYLSQREHILEIEELGSLAENLGSYRADLPECISEQFEEAATESIDSLSYSEIPAGDDRETIISDWLEKIDKIESYLGRSVDSWKRRELEEHLGNIQHAHEMDMERHRGEQSLNRSSSSTGSIFQSGSSISASRSAQGGFSNVDLENMFSSLKK